MHKGIHTLIEIKTVNIFHIKEQKYNFEMNYHNVYGNCVF